MRSIIDPEDFLEHLDATTVHADPLPTDRYKFEQPWQMLMEVRDPEDPFFGFVSLHEGIGATPSSSNEAMQFEFFTAVKAGVRKARELNQTQNLDRDRLYIINAARTSLARIVLPEKEVLLFFKSGSISEGATFYD